VKYTTRYTKEEPPVVLAKKSRPEEKDKSSYLGFIGCTNHRRFESFKGKTYGIGWNVAIIIAGLLPMIQQLNTLPTLVVITSIVEIRANGNNRDE